jgi:hypothetical protein
VGLFNDLPLRIELLFQGYLMLFRKLRDFSLFGLTKLIELKLKGNTFLFRSDPCRFSLGYMCLRGGC